MTVPLKTRQSKAWKAKQAAAQRKWRAENAERNKANVAAWAARNPHKKRATYRRHDLKRHFGITVEQYESILVRQNGVCAICRLPERRRLHGKIVRLSVDHDHLTGQVRGLLCSLCNTGLGNMFDDPMRLRAAAAYVEHFMGED